MTPGVYDHRPLVPHLGIPEDLSGKRVLDVGTFDGFWAFEFERRGADVVALDLARWTDGDHPAGVREHMVEHGLDAETGVGFLIAHEALSSKVKRVTGRVTDLTPDTVGTFDIVHMGDVLLHQRDPLLALQRVRKVTDGWALIVDSINTELPVTIGRHITEYRGGWPWRDYHYWLPTLDTLAQMTIDAGFAEVSVHNIYRLDLKSVSGAWRAVLIART
ncbi:MAG: class I SAM-dependent methyltransferase [Acidimicrobiales bacterium]